MNAATREEALIYVPGFVFLEIAMLLKIGRVSLQESYGDWAEHLVAQAGFDAWLLGAVGVRGCED